MIFINKLKGNLADKSIPVRPMKKKALATLHLFQNMIMVASTTGHVLVIQSTARPNCLLHSADSHHISLLDREVLEGSSVMLRQVKDSASSLTLSS